VAHAACGWLAVRLSADDIGAISALHSDTPGAIDVVFTWLDTHDAVRR
jgi:hypothetical protein